MSSAPDKLSTRPRRAYSTARDQLQAKTPPFRDEFHAPGLCPMHLRWGFRSYPGCGYPGYRLTGCAAVGGKPV
jgi:hypothetical protein